MNIYPFAGEIKMTRVIKDGQEVIEWEQVDMSKHSYGSLGIGTPSQVKWDASAPLTMGKPVERVIRCMGCKYRYDGKPPTNYQAKLRSKNT